MKEVRVRFAPSPTGFLHVGGARTAIFNWLFARNQKGKFLLRIEDTDPERSKSELSAQILRSMQWLEMESDETVVYQSDNIASYRSAAQKLVDSGKAYYAFESIEETDRKRSEAKSQNLPYKYDRASLSLNKEQIEKNIADGKEYSVRFRVPEGDTLFEDIVHGQTSFRNSEIDDFVVLRSDGSPVYQLAVVVDDHDMAITHVIRGDDHLSNTPKQIMLYNALGWEVPQFAHLPMILDEQKKKLSKRRNTVSVEEYKEQGFLSDALFNFLTLLGFAPENNREIVSKQELVKEFTFERVNKKPAVFDMNKLAWINFQYIKDMESNVVTQMVKEKLLQTGRLTPDAITGLSEEYLTSIVQIMKERVTTINDFIGKGIYFFTEPAEYDEKGLAKYWNAEIKKSFTEYAAVLEKLAEWNAEDLETHLREFAESKGLKAGQIIHPLRLALTGQTTSPGIFEVMVLLGRRRSLVRINKFLNLSVS